jgi:carboxypeptidase Taq
MYEQGVNAAYEGTPLGSGVSAGIHESQSRLWENVVARSRPFWEYYYPSLQRTFADQFGSVPLDSFYRAINKVGRSLIRTDADEVTYNLHIMLRFDLELKLLEGRLRVKDLPEAWRTGMQAVLGIMPLDDRDGCLQDVHWYLGSIGGQESCAPAKINGLTAGSYRPFRYAPKLGPSVGGTPRRFDSRQPCMVSCLDA